MTGAAESRTVSVRLPLELADALEQMAETASTDVSTLMRQSLWYAVESNFEGLALSAKVDAAREEIKRQSRPIDMAGGFPGRCRKAFEKRFKNHYRPKWLAAKAESYRKEARRLQDLVQQHPNCPEMEDGELEADVEDELSKALEAMDLTNWYSREDNHYKRFGGVDDAQQRRSVYIRAVQNAMRIREELDSALKTANVPVRAEDLPEAMDDSLPVNVDRDDVAEAANHLFTIGVDPDDVAEALREFDPRAWEPGDDPDGDVDPEDDPSDDPADVADDGPGPNPGPATAEDVESTQDPTPNPQMQPQHNAAETLPTRDELLDTLAEKVELYAGPDDEDDLGRKKRQAIRGSAKDTMQTAIDERGLDVEQLLDNAVERVLGDERAETVAATEGSA